MEYGIDVRDAEKIKATDVMDELDSTPSGLTTQEASRRCQTCGFNEITDEKVNPFVKFLKFFWGPIPWMIEIALILSLIIQHWEEFTVILILLLINGGVGFYQEFKADNAIDLLKDKLAYHVHVLRDGKWVELPSKMAVPGDVVRIHIGDIVPADLKLIKGSYVTVDESTLTGESLPVDKKLDDIVYSGSVVQRGDMLGMVLATGMNTYFGKAAELIAGVKPKSHLEEAVVKIGDYLIVLDLIMVSFIFIAGLFRHESFFDILGFSLVLTIASVPVAQPAVLSVTMTVGAMALAKKKAIVSKLTSIEEMAGMDVLFSDKTGTLTKNQIVIAEIAPYGEYTDEDVLFYAGLASTKNGDPLDEAIFKKIDESEDLTEKIDRYKTLKFNPFDPICKMTEAEIEYQEDYKFSVSKGAPQVILNRINDGKTEDKVCGTVDLFAEKGYRALGVAKTDKNGVWEFVGLITLYDAPRRTSKDTITQTKSLGVKVKMITGDHIAIAKQTAKELGLKTNIELPSSFLDKGEMKAQETIENASGFAEVFPEHKYKLVEILQRSGKIVGMTGDGVNDAPALRKADVGIAVASAVDAAKSAADIVFTKPGLSVIINAIKESYKIFHRMKSYSIYRVAETIRILIFTAMVILIFNIYPVTALMLVLIALLDDLPVMTIAYDRTEKINSPQRWDMRQVLSMSTFLGVLGVLSSLLLFYIGADIFNLSIAFLQSIIFLKLVVAGHLTMFVTRNTGHFWSVRPSGLFFWSVILTDIFATVLVLSGAFLAPISWELAIFVWVYSLIAFVIEDYLKIYFAKVMDHSGIKYLKNKG